ncbi:MAG TPA: hypothetical protein VFW73_05100 [Lacipirellulaceae bacterium]|nr:hypothetical protein [Lacipirellulaceae bacterium]
MNVALIVGFCVFICSLGGALLGMFVASRLPKTHLGESSKDVIKVATAVVATLAALVVGLLISAAKGSFDTKDMRLKQIAAQTVLLYQKMVEYGPETHEARAVLHGVIAHAIAAIWTGNNHGTINPRATEQGTGTLPVQHLLLQLVPKNDAQRWLKSSALQVAGEIEAERVLALQQIGGSIQWPFLAILGFWFAIIFLSFGLFAPINSSVFVVLFACSLSVAAALYLIVQMDRPYSGFMQISSAPLQLALRQIGN